MSDVDNRSSRLRPWSFCHILVWTRPTEQPKNWARKIGDFLLWKWFAAFPSEMKIYFQVPDGTWIRLQRKMSTLQCLYSSIRINCRKFWFIVTFKHSLIMQGYFKMNIWMNDFKDIAHCKLWLFICDFAQNMIGCKARAHACHSKGTFLITKMIIFVILSLSKHVSESSNKHNTFAGVYLGSYNVDFTHLGIYHASSTKNFNGSCKSIFSIMESGFLMASSLMKEQSLFRWMCTHN